MNNELNKYFPEDITNIILEIHYKSIFNESILKLEEYMTSDRYESDDDEDEDDDDIPKDWSERYYINSFRGKILYQYNKKKRR